MGRSFEVRRKSENLPVIGYTFVVFSRVGTHVWLYGLIFAGCGSICAGRFKTAVPFVGAAVFLLVCPRDKGRIERKEVNRMVKRHEHFICVEVS
jgi:hypothetical protein